MIDKNKVSVNKIPQDSEELGHKKITVKSSMYVDSNSINFEHRANLK